METFVHNHRGKVKAGFLLLVVVVLAATIVGALYVEQKLTNRSYTEFRADAADVSRQITNQTESYNDLLYAARALVTSDPGISQDSWQEFFATQDTINRNSGVSSVYFAERVPAADVPAFQARQRAVPAFGDNFTVHPIDANQQEYVVSTLIYSNNPVAQGLGFNVFSTANRKIVYEEAAQNNRPTGSELFKLRSGFMGFFITLPVFSASHQPEGFVGITLRAEDFMKKLLASDLSNMAVQISDITAPDHPTVLYDTDNWQDTPEELQYKQQLSVGDRTWEVFYKSARPYAYAQLNRGLPRLVMVLGGLILIVIAFVYSHLKTRAKHHAEITQVKPKKH